MVITWPENVNSKEKLRRKKVADYFALEEQKEMEEFLDALKEQLRMSSLYGEYEKECIKFFKGLDERVKKKYFNEDNEPTRETEEKILAFYSELLDIDEYYENYLKE